MSSPNVRPPTRKGRQRGFTNATGCFYVIFDAWEGYIQYHTFSKNRREAWNKFCKPEERAKWKSKGFKCVFVVVDGPA